LTATPQPSTRGPIRTRTSDLGPNSTSHDAPPAAAPELPVDRSANQVEPFKDNWNLGLTYSYSGGYGGPTPGLASPRWASTRDANAVVSYQLSPGWSLEYSASYDPTERQ